MTDEKASENDDAETIGEWPNEGRLAGIDYGTVRIGVAITDATRTISSPLEVYTRRNEKLDAKYFCELAELERVAGFVVGLPVHMSGDPSEKSREAIKFGNGLLSKRMCR